MSHTIRGKSPMTNVAAIAAACRSMGIAAPVQGEASFGGQTHRGLLVNLPGWSNPVVIDVRTGDLAYDNYGGQWGDNERLLDLRQRYAVERDIQAAREVDPTIQVHEHVLSNGRIKLVFEGVAA